MDHLNLAEITTLLKDTVFAGKVHHFESIDSTNTFAVREAQGGAPHGSVYVADAQTAGRGRGGHTWLSRVGDGLYVSVLLRPQLPVERALWISLAAGLAARAAVKAVAGADADIRWPNDLLIGEKKFGGILVEASLTGVSPYAVVGVGLNLNHAEFPANLAGIATSLRMACGHEFAREDVLVELLRSLENEVTYLERGDAVLERFAEASTWVRGKRVSVPEDDGYVGVTDGLDERGFLRVRSEDGRVRTVINGGVRAL